MLERIAPTNESDSSRSSDASGTVVSALAGMGGIGKTALALQAAATAAQREWFCAYLFVDLRGYSPGAQPMSAEAALDVLLRQMGVAPEDVPPGVNERSSFYRSALASLSREDELHRPVLVLADNANTTAQLRPLLPGPGGHRLVTTSRRQLGSLPAARHLDLAILDPDSAITLLTTALKTSDPKDPRAEDLRALGRLAKLCEFLPLALEIAAAQLMRKPHLAPDRLADRLEQATSRVEKLTDRDQDGTLRAVFDRSLNQMSLEEVRVFLLVAAAPGPTTSTAAIAVLTSLPEDEVEEILEELAAAHLLTQPTPGRWGVHDLLADHARTHPHLPQDLDRATTRLLDHYTGTARAADAHLRALPGQPVPDRFLDQKSALAWLDAERATLVDVALAAPELGHTEAAIHLPLNLAEYLSHRRRFEEWEQVSRSAQTIARTHGDQAGEACAWNNLGLALQEMHRFEEAVDAHTRARNLHHHVGDAHGQAQA
ncbi:NB-ARC domain-containing protein, partial [Nocardiopsis aegyptia]|uniref:NB-ARC domain-containing protein n=1 Tax=Nocardiopsis aegyptia TaxID=220378 RepID=UPI00366C3256